MAAVSTDALAVLLTQGVLGVFCVLLIGALVFCAKALLKSKDDRLADQKEMAKALGEINSALQDLVVESNKHASELVLDASRSQDAMRAALSNQERTVTALQTELIKVSEHIRYVGSARK